MRKEAVKMEKKMKTKVKKDNSSFIGKIIYSPYSIVVVLMIFVIVLLMYARYLVRSNSLYTFSGFTEEFSIFGGTIYEGPIINHFGDSKILYTGSDIGLYDFEVGYYIKNGDKYSPISTTKGYDVSEEGDKKNKKLASLKDIIMGTGFSFTETHKEAVFLSEENMSNLDNLVFRVTGKDKNDKLFEIEVPLAIEKVTK